MANVFKIPITNPFRFVNANSYSTVNPRYDTLPFDLKKDGKFNPNGFYAQKWQINDFTAFQFNSDFADATFKVYEFNAGSYYDVNAPYASFPITTPPVSVRGVTWVVYECAVDFAAFAPGLYVGVLSYTDENAQVQHVQTSPLDVRVKHYGSLLYEYFNTENDKGIIWKTGIRMSIRVEGLIREFTPGALTEEYIDQQYNTYSLNDIPYRTFKNYIGSARGLPDWIIDKMNVIFTLDSVGIDGTGYAKKSGQSFQITRPEKGYNEDGYAEIDIIPNENYNLEAYITETPPNGTFKVIAEVLQYYDNELNITINGIFKIHTTLVGLAIWNKSGTALIIKVGTTNGGSEIGKYPITNDLTSFVLINKVFKQVENVFITGLTAANLDIDVRYDDYDAPNSATNPFSSGFIPNVEYTYYEDNVGDFVRDFDFPTGMGKVGTDFENCFLLDGQNNTLNDAYLYRMGLDPATPSLRNTIVGNTGNQVALSRNELPAEGIEMFDDIPNPTAGDTPTPDSTVAYARNAGNQALNYETVKGRDGIQPSIGLTANLGSGNPVDITPESLVVTRFIYRRPVV